MAPNSRPPAENHALRDAEISEHEQFRLIVHQRVQRLKRSLPDDIAHEIWFVRCYHSKAEFDREFSSAIERAQIVRKMAAIEAAADEAGARIKNMLQGVDLNEIVEGRARQSS